MNQYIITPAFPSESAAYPECLGMTLRDYFAAKAMQALMTKCGPYTDDTTSEGAFPMGREDAPDVSEVAEYAYVQADAMLKARES